ncbi:MAG: DUF3575 domain-containing protein [Chitinophagia bacterium]|jgi:hypothetical protein
MKKVLFILASLTTLQVNAQKLIGGKNIIKGNLTSFALKNYHLSFERSLNHFMSVSASYRYMPKGSLPLQAIAKKYIDNPAINFDLFQMGNNALTFESRFYLGLQKMSGFYIAPYARFADFDLSVPVEYTYTPEGSFIAPTPITKSANLDGLIKSTSYGAYIGLQKQLLTKLVIDIWFIGGHFGSSNGTLNFIAPEKLPTQAVSALQKVLDNTKVSPFEITSKVNQNGATADMKGPWAGFRGLGISLGLRF